jgi:GTP cyclohydrolase I
MNRKQNEQLYAAVETILAAFDPEPTREGLQDTPRRYIKFLNEFLNPEPFELTTFNKESYDEFILVKRIPFFSLCEHHLAPFFGHGAIAYIPNESGRICGLSKLPRTLHMFARKFQNQERITQQVAEFLMEKMNPKGVAVSLTARHFCMEMRGIRTHDAETVTTALLGVFRTEPATRQEFLNQIK